MITGKMNSFQSLGTVDGPGIRAVVFLQGCPLRCVCCHNPDTWDPGAGATVTVDELVKKILRCKAYFGREGGVTVSGGEPLLQAEFVTELFSKLQAEGIHTALDTSGCIWNPAVSALLSVTDLVILDYKYTVSEDYLRYTNCPQEKVDFFLKELDKRGTPTWIRQVIIPGLNDQPALVRRLNDLRTAHPVIRRIELLPFRKLCLEKYHAMHLPFPLEDTPEASSSLMSSLQALIK